MHASSHDDENWLLPFEFNRVHAKWGGIPNDKTFFVGKHKDDSHLEAWLGQPQWSPYD